MIRVNGISYIVEEFHNGEAIFKEPKGVKADQNNIQLFFKDNRDITNLQFLKMWIDDHYPEACNILEIKYCPYERMDRAINDQIFSMRYFARLVKQMKFHVVEILDPHSEVCLHELYENGVNVRVLDLEAYVTDVVERFKPDYICYPDKGAYNKYPRILRSLHIPYFYGQKTRDLANKGKIVDYELVDAPDLKNKKVLIIDDICCLGGTAYNAAKQMKFAGAEEVAFYISHCENGIFAGRILHPEPCVPDGSDVETLPWAGKYTIDRVFTADTMSLDNWHDNITRVD